MCLLDNFPKQDDYLTTLCKPLVLLLDMFIKVYLLDMYHCHCKEAK